MNHEWIQIRFRTRSSDSCHIDLDLDRDLNLWRSNFIGNLIVEIDLDLA